jgi:outer membrane protein assembly factor BamB
MKIQITWLVSLALFIHAQAARGQESGKKLWEFAAAPRIIVDPMTGETLRLPSYIFSSPAVGPDQTIYFGSGNGTFYALNPSGSEKWSFRTGAEIQSSPAIGRDGTIYFGSVDGKLYALNPDGSRKWEFSTGYYVLSSPAIAADGTVYIGSRDKNVYAVHPDGSLKWSFATGGYVDSSPVIGADGTIYVGSFDWNVYALNPDGTEKWRFTYGAGPAGGLGAGIAIGLEETLYVVTGDGRRRLHAFRPDGTKVWEFAFDDGVALTYASAPVVGPDGTIYATSNDRKVYAVNPDGTKKWDAFTGAYSQSSPVLGRDGTLYSSGDLTLFAFDGAGVKQWEFQSDLYGTAGGITSIPNLSYGAILYVGSGNGNFYALKASEGLAESAWPAFRRDSYQSARATGTVVRRPNSISAKMTAEGLALAAALESGNTYRLESSADLKNWTTVTSLSSDSGVAKYIEPWEAGTAFRFYRLVSP